MTCPRVVVYPDTTYAGAFVYAVVAREGTPAVLEAATGRIVAQIALGTNPTGLYVRRLR